MKHLFAGVCEAEEDAYDVIFDRKLECQGQITTPWSKSFKICVLLFISLVDV